MVLSPHYNKMFSCLVEPGLWVQKIVGERSFSGRPALYLDRDGVINKDTGYPGSVADIHILETAIPLISEANAKEIAVIVITNQSGIGRGYYSWDAFSGIMTYIVEELKSRGARLDYVLACAYHAEGIVPYQYANHPMRKPNPGMIHEAVRLSDTIPSRSVIVGDKDSDMIAGRMAGLQRGWLVGSPSAAQALTSPSFPVDPLPADSRQAL